MDRILEKLAAGKVAFGTHISFGDSSLTELIGNTGYDFLWIDMEHTPLEKDAIQHHLIAARAAGVSSLVRLPWNDPVTAKPILEMGPDGIIFPMVSSAEEAEKAVGSCLYPPDGFRGFGPRRATKYGLDDLNEYVEKTSRRTWKIIMLESIFAVKDLDAILEIKGIDAFIVGPYDLSASIGKIGSFESKPYLDAIDIIFSKVLASGRPLGVSIGTYSKADIELWLERGVNIISVGGDIAYLLDGSLKAVKNFEEAVGNK